MLVSISKVILTTEEMIPTLKVISATTSCSDHFFRGQDHFVRDQLHTRGS